jgi:cyclopropane fatty-acyl-phospholipid synthase-like methyltransferase
MSREFWSEVNDIEEAKKRILDAEFIPDKILEEFDYKGKVVLDFGCGVGRNLKYLTHTSAIRIIGFDFPNMIEMSKLFLTEEERNKVQFSKPPFLISKTEKVDIIIASLVFQHIDDIYLLNYYLSLLYNLLYDNGFMYVNSRGYIDYGLGCVWPHILRVFKPITYLNENDGSENHQQVLFKKI